MRNLLLEIVLQIIKLYIAYINGRKSSHHSINSAVIDSC